MRPPLTVRLSPPDAESPAVSVSVPAEVVLAATVSGLDAEMVVAPPVLDADVSPPAAPIVSAPALEM